MGTDRRILKGVILALVLSCCSSDSPQTSLEVLAEFITRSNLPDEWEPVVHQTTLGTIAGRKEPTMGLHRSNTHYYAFRGIPYAEPPVGQLRLEDPVEVKGRWPGGHLNATQYQSVCPQYSPVDDLVFGDEDCLYLNVFTPELPEAGSVDKGLPVFLFIHGGGFLRGSSSVVGAARLVAQQLVFVTFNYRLGALGFLSTDDKTIPGNYGSLDQIAALRWVNSYIAQFGGDPNKVTLGGFSAGAASAYMHLMSPMAKGLFQGAFLMSGSGRCSWAVQSQPRRMAARLANNLGCPFTSSAHLKSCIVSKSYEEVLRAQGSILKYVFWPAPFSMVVDAGLRDDPFLPAHADILTPTTTMPILISTVQHEGLMFALGILMETKEPSNPTVAYDEAVREIISTIWYTDTYAEEVAQLAEAFYYTPRARYSLDTLLEEMTEELTDFMFGSCAHDTAVNLATTDSKVYRYILTHRDPEGPVWAEDLLNKGAELGIKSPILKKGISHGDDILLLFSNEEFHPDGEVLSFYLTSIWASFITTGSPQGVGGPGSSVPEWTPLVAGEPVGYYNICLQPSMVHTPYKLRASNFWKQTLPVMEDLLESRAAVSNANVKEEL